MRVHLFTGGRQHIASACAGVIAESHVEHYVEFKRRLQELVHSDEQFRNGTLLELQERQGFGFAVKAALELVETKFVIVVQVINPSKNGETKTSSHNQIDFI